ALAPERLGGKDRVLSFVATDKPIYRPGETVRVRAVLLQADTYFPLRERPTGGLPRLRIAGPRQEEVFQSDSDIDNSVAAFNWTIPAGQAGGLYQATVVACDGPPSVRFFEVRAYAPPRLKTRIEFLREGYGPGETVTAAANIRRAEGGVPENARVTAVVRVDGAETARIRDVGLDAEGICRISFSLPPEMERGEGTLAFIIEDGGVIETAAKTIPILLQTLDISFHPEGGELVAGLPGRLYVAALRPDGKPADLEGVIVRLDAAGQALAETPLADLKTAHEGRGAALFTPRKGESYALRLNRPAGIAKLFPLPPVRVSGAVVAADREIYEFAEPVTLTVRASPDSGAARVTLHHRERLVAEAPVAAAGETRAILAPGEAEGVLIATVWDNRGLPLAERLVFRAPKFKVRISLKAEAVPAGGSPIPGGGMRLKVETKDENGRPVEAVVGLSVVDDSLLEMREKRDQPPALPAMVYLENEVKDLADSQVYFDPDNPDAARAVDLLLATQGWRRFVLVRLDEALKTDPDNVRRALAIRVPPLNLAVPKNANIRRMDFAQPMLLMADGVPADEEEVPVPDQLYFDAAVPLAGAILEKGEPRAPLPPQLAAGIPLADAIPEMARRPRDIPARPDPEPEAKVLPQALILRQGEPVAPAPMPTAPRIFIREYAHKARPNRRANDRMDFAETLYWHAGLRTNPRDGEATVEFDLSDSVTAFRIRADAFGNNGALGEASGEIVSREPFAIEPKLPTTMMAGDQAEIPVALVNATAGELAGVGLTAEADGLDVSVPECQPVLAPGERGRGWVKIASGKPGAFTLILKAAAGGYADTVSREITVLPRGFPIRETASGLVGPGRDFAREFTLPDDLVPGSLKTSVKIYPTPLANLEEALNALLRQPHGCFEQASSTNYPLVMAQRYFLSHAGVDPDRIAEAGKLLEEGYRRLSGFECRDRGYEWFGENPGHEALTAYGLMQFTEMAEIMPVDPAMLSRTREWLLARRDGEGGFSRNEKALDSFGAAPAPLTNLYILWTLLESGEKPEKLVKEIDAARRRAAESRDPYILALGANILYLAGDLPAARSAAARLREAQGRDGALAGAETSITRSAGESLVIETTSLAIIAWLRCGDDFAGTVETAMGWLFAHCQAGRFGSTQSTILALKAINAYDAARARPKAPGTAQLTLDGKPFGRPAAFDENTRGALELPDFSAALAAGGRRVGIVMEGGGDLPFSITVDCHSTRPADSPDCPLGLAVSLSTAAVEEGEPVDLAVEATAGPADAPMPVAV
ncbi:MAG: A-macroglobulin complement component, partial [Planctomycetota bacterium]|nr:A-macroglobulin complement component [Planctomycetota bacterium]